MNEQLIEMLDKLQLAIEASTQTVKICTPNADYYARSHDWVSDTVQIINPETLCEKIGEMIAELQ